MYYTESFTRKTKAKNVLFLCETNSIYSQIAEAYLNKKASRSFQAYSAGFSTKHIQQSVVNVLREDGIDITMNKSKTIYSMELSHLKFDYVISFCDPENPTQQPVFPNKHKKIKWNMRQNFTNKTNEEELMQSLRKTRDQIKAAVYEFIDEQLSVFEDSALQLV
jgi:arsenate reductase